MSTTLAAPGVQGRRPWKFAAPIVAVVVLIAIGIAIAAAVLLQPKASTVPASGGALNAQQLVIQSEVSDRYASGGLTDQQLVIESEVADRYGPTTGLTAQQLVIQSEVADRYAGH